MPCPEVCVESVRAIQVRIASLARRVRWHRGITWGTRGLLCSLLAALPLLVARSALPGPTALWLVGLLLVGTGGGLCYGLVQPVPLRDLARLVEERLHLNTRLSTAVECAERGDRSPFACALYADALRTLPRFTGTDVLPMRLPREGWGLIPTAAMALLLWTAPPLRVHGVGLLEHATRDARTREEGAAPKADDETAQPATLEVPEFRDRRWQAGRAPSSRLAREMDAVFQDSPLAKDRPDFSSFVVGGDERMRFLGRPQAIPDLKGEDLRSPYQIVVQKMQELSEGGTRKLTPDEMRRLLDEVRRLGKKGGLPGLAGSPGSEELMDATGEAGREALERALEGLRKQDEARLKGSQVLPETGRGPRAAQGAPGGEEAAEEERGRDDAFGTFAGRGKSEGLRGEPTPRIETTPRTIGLQGEAGAGASQVYNTNLLGAGQGGKATLPRADILTRYRQMMEEALSRDRIPPDYREQVKTYFDSLSTGKGEPVR